MDTFEKDWNTAIFRDRKALPEAITVALSDREISVKLRRNPRARKYILRLPMEDDAPVLTVPHGGTLSTAQRFAEKQALWIEERLSKRAPKAELVEGVPVPLRGKSYTLKSSGKLRGLVEAVETEEGAVLIVPGEPQALGRKLIKFYKEEARKDLEAAVARYTARIGRQATAISVRDTKSRWGSCASNGRLSFSWRLILAPPDILEYVAAHEVAHLMHMDHSDAFWKLCYELAPHTRTAQNWLKAHGAQLHLIN
ncbi:MULTISPECIES: M48 family metallopeptidase [Pseudovibrio]|uniref:M48 family metallopeptidase n=1 Tax=Stappiaceae TaxID=2821832 RepID=UPI00236515B2|nr:MULTISPECIES: SprT family zinc-dependent metalloprotease [Pseudovibrio]MDD7909574.1 SprT family zinc-dependent metalloprotease [Pseudovibrio exalbescens]MDX5595073.1 SprT family zinc-dependent metalloprotease [Pseudovibrio sp. SPO723]